MRDQAKIYSILWAAVSIGMFGFAGGAAAEEAAWQVSKSSGEVWVAGTGAQKVSLSEAALKGGDHLRTGRNGRVLLTRGSETIMVSPNSDIELPTEPKDGLATTIMQHAGSVLIEAEKQAAPHFQVQTPYLAAVVKGTQFSVTVNPQGGSVTVMRGQVDVADFKSGDHVMVLPGQSAKVSIVGPVGLSLSGTGTLSPIEHGTPRAPSVTPLAVPKGGLAALHSGPEGHTGHSLGAGNALHIGSALGEVKLNFQRITNGLARAATAPGTGPGRRGQVNVIVEAILA